MPLKAKILCKRADNFNPHAHSSLDVYGSQKNLTRLRYSLISIAYRETEVRACPKKSSLQHFPSASYSRVRGGKNATRCARSEGRSVEERPSRVGGKGTTMYYQHSTACVKTAVDLSYRYREGGKLVCNIMHAGKRPMAGPWPTSLVGCAVQGGQEMEALGDEHGLLVRPARRSIVTAHHGSNVGCCEAQGRKL